MQPGERVFGFVFLPPDTLWLHRMASLEAYRWDGSALNVIRRVGPDQGLPAVESGGVMADRSGTLWLTTTRGLLRYDPVGGRLRIPRGPGLGVTLNIEFVKSHLVSESS